ncbi:hypothetical protein GCM10011585_32780 [Edaphobacter dinghuensis]|uniref:Carrier domain-containing protein n=1 Tax=Edaphobacter dinghuensis TaxID=1560005 RepID=A0A917HQR4_9BACT|nr:hypothetical protein GCM10011585_32780 [Edaphobacter dinghuensis]
MLLEAWNQTPAPSLDGRCIHQMFEEQVRKSPEAVAVVFGGESLSYTQLNRQANCLAHYLIELGVEPDDRVAICADRGVSMLVCLMAILKAGGAYVPLDLAYASERLSQILSDAAPRLLLCDKLGREVLVSEATQGLVVVELDALRPVWSSQPETDPEVAGLTSRHLAYVIYTSGSTGTPKGVMVEHAQITRLFEVTQNSYGFSDQDVWCLFHSFAFDFSVWEIWGALRYGGRLVIVPYEMARSSRDFYRLVCEQQVTVLNQTPSAFRMLMEAEAESSLSDRLRYVIFGGEALDPTILRSWYWRRSESQPLLVNMYGITETTVHVTYRPLASSDTAASASPIGIRLADLRIYLLDNRQQPVPLGAVGEMYIGGAGVARGYLNRPELTTERFLDDPFCDEPGARMYRTGDLARYLPDGNLEFLGRNDQQVKIRGFRIELGEIEARLADHPLVEQTVVIAREDTSGDKRLIAYYTTASDPAGLTAEQLREHLSVLLPEYMVPAAFVHLETLPLTPNGKLDRKALPAPENGVYAAHDYEQPQGETEIALAEIWKELLHLDRVGRNDNFFELGGHSLLAVRLLSRVAQVIGIELQLTDLFSYPTPARLATAITERCSRNDPELLLPITPLRLEEHLPLSYAQQRLWFLSQFEGVSAAYHVPAGLRLRGDLDCMSLRRSLNTIFARHEALRSTFVAVDGHPEVFLLSNKASVPFIQIDLRTATNMKRRLEALCREQIDTPFDLSRGPMVRACLVRLGDREHVLILVQHHIVSDGWSLGIFCRELSTLYTAYLNGKPDPLSPLEIQYPDYAAWQRKWLAGKRLEKQVTYWKKTLSDAPPLLELPTDRPRPPQQSFAGAQLTVRIDAELTKALKALSAKHGATLFMTLLTAWAAVLSRLSGQDDLVIGTPVANRRHVQVENLIGFFVNTLALRIDLSGNPTVEQLLLRVRTATLEAQDHQDLPFEQVVEIINPPRRLDRAPIFQVMLVSQEEPGSLLSIPNLELQVDDLSAYTAKFDLELDISEEGDEVVGTLRYSTLLFDELTMKRHAAYLYTILGRMVADSGQVVGSIDLLSPEESHLLVVTQNETAVPYPKDSCIHQLIEEQARTTPEAIAVVIGDRFLSYAELNRQANCLAHYLIEQGVRPDDRVAVCIDRGLSLIVGLLAVLKAGGAYMPLDPGYPSDRLAYVLADAQPGVLLCDAIGWEILGSGSGNETVMVDVDNSRPVWSQLSPTNPDVAGLTSRHLAYVIYTSGSTGTPKGVMVEHRSLSNHIHWQAQAFTFTAEDIFLQRTAISFDASVWEIWTPLAIGARLILLPSDLQRDPVGIATTIAKNHVTVAQFVPSLLEATLRSGTFQCRYLFCGGEPLSAALVQEAQRYTSEGVVNLYGPTETTIDATCWHFRNQTVPEVIPIGRPIANTRIYLMDSERQLVPLGAVGELYIGGAGVARGYLNRPDLTSERFLPDPFSAETGARIYRTGDLARYLSDGNLEFLGRNDHQVKIRGFRIELGEIEARLAEYPLVKQALVIAREDVPGNKRLVAYYTGDASVTAEQLRTHLAELLPEYMVPAAFAHLNALPLAPNGKLDRKALPAPEGDAYAAHAYEPPQGEAETVLAEIWKELLHVERVGRNDNFFELGGHSLLAVRLQAHVQKRLNLELSLAHIFGSNTLSALAQIIAASLADAVPDDLQTITATPRSAPLPLSFAQQRLWFLSQFENLNASYHIAALLQLDGDLDHSSLQSSLSTIFARHEALRSTFITIGGEPFVKLLPQEKEFILPEYDLREFAAQATRFRALCEEQFRTPFDLATGPMVRACLVHLRDQEHVLILVMHHIVSDGWSMGFLVRELNVLYTAYLNGEPNPLPPLEIQYPDYAAWQRLWLTGERLETQVDYWKKALADAPPLLDLPTDRPRPLQQSFAGAQIPVRIDAELTKALKALSTKHGTTLFMTLLAAWAAVLSRLSGQEDLVIGTPVANRRHIQVENLIGFFVNTLALRIDLSGNPTVEELLRRVRIATLEAQDHQDLPFEQVVEIINPPRRLDHTPIFQVMFAWRNEETNIPQLPRVHASLLDSSYVNSRYGLELDLAEDSGMIVGTLTYASALFDEVTTERQIGYLQVVLQAMVADTRQEVDSINLLSAEERDLLHERWNSTTTRYPSNLCIHQLFEEQAAKSPDATAVLWQNGSLTYEELNRRANRLAHHLVELGVRPDDPVAICMDRSPEMVVSLLATLKAGAAYMPLDPAHPPERIVQVLEDAEPRILLCDGTGQKALEGKATRNILLLNLDSGSPAWSHQPEVDPHVSSLTSRHLAYVIYTSGSTGTPKGVMNEHRGVVNRLVWMQETYKLRPDDVVLQKTSFSFDVSVWEFFWTLMTGATLALAPPGAQADPDRLIELICEWNVSIVHFVPSLLDIFMHTPNVGRCTSLRQLICSGEALQTVQLKACLEQLPAMQVDNLYGPTEAAIDVTAWACPPEFDSIIVPIGRPIANIAIYLLDHRRQPVPLGAVGEMYIGGVGVARGYLNRPELTAERFLADPFCNDAGARMYRTGDLARYLPDGNLEFLGRNDQQVKLRGFRIELGEIEARLVEYPHLEQAVVVAREEKPGDKRLVAYYSGAESLSAERLRNHLASKLPEYMVPSAFVRLDALPLTPNGKIDRKALPAPEGDAYATRAYEPPQGETETAVAEIWKELLHTDRIGRNDNFFELGGHSLLAVRLLSRLQARFELKIDLSTLFENPQLAPFSKRVLIASIDQEFHSTDFRDLLPKDC